MRATKLQNRIAKILKENTGTHFLDSGFDNGRNWQRNQKKNFLETPRVIIDKNFGDYSINLFWYLDSVLEITEQSEIFNNKLKNARKKGDDLHWVQDCEEYLSEFFELENVKELQNTYNWQNDFSQDMLFIEFEYQWDKYVLLQVHGGADIRGGYTDTQVFKIGDYSEFAYSSIYGNYDGIQVDNYYNGYSLTNEDGEEVEIKDWSLLILDFNSEY